MAQFVMLKLPAERHSQLKELAKAYGVSMVALITKWINAEIATGVIPDELPGFDVTPAYGKVVLSIQRRQLAPWAPADAILFAASLEEYSEKMADRRILNLDLAGLPLISRTGSALTIEAEAIDGRRIKRIVSPGVARDVARLIRAAATKAER